MAADLEKLFGKGAPAEQLLVWGILAQALAAVLGPEFQFIQRGVNSKIQATPLSPADLADMVVRSVIEQGDASEYAKQSGIAPSDFERLVANTGEPISLQEAIQAVRRNFIASDGAGVDRVTLEQVIRESRIKTKYRGVIEQLADVPIGVADAVDAAVEGQISYSDAEQIAGFSGISPDNFKILFDTRGNPPSPSELAELLKRGFIPLEGTGPDAVSFQQGIFEGATKDKWWRLFARLADYVPPPRTVTAMVREGSLTDDQALALFKQAGLTQDLAAAYLTSAHHQKTDATRKLTVATILQLYKDRLIDQQTCGNLLLALNYSQADAAFEIQLADFDVAQSQLRSAVSRLQTLFVNHKLTVSQVTSALDALHMPPAARDQLLQTWQLEAAANVKILTPAEIAELVKLGALAPDDGVQELMDQGYNQRDARLRIIVTTHVDYWAAPAPPPAA